MFAPKNYESKFLQYYLQHSVRPPLVMLALQGKQFFPVYLFMQISQGPNYPVATTWLVNPVSITES